VSCVLNVARFSGLSILDCPSVLSSIVYLKFKYIKIVIPIFGWFHLSLIQVKVASYCTIWKMQYQSAAMNDLNIG
jgi:hypothetical protein